MNNHAPIMCIMATKYSITTFVALHLFASFVILLSAVRVCHICHLVIIYNGEFGC